MRRPCAQRGLAVVSLLALSLALNAQQTGWRADPKVVEQTSRKQPGFNYDESRVPRYTLPDVMSGSAGKVSTAEQWKNRRAEILELFREHVYGRSFGLPQEFRFKVIEENPKAMDGAATLKRVAVMSAHNGRELAFELTMFLPNARRERVGLFLLLNNRPQSNTDPTRKEKSGFWPAEQVIARGYGIAALQVEALALDDRFRFRDAAISALRGLARPAGAAAHERVGGARGVGLGREPRTGLSRHRSPASTRRASPSSATHAAGRRRCGPAPRISGSAW